MANIVTDAVTGVFNLFDTDVAFSNVYANHNEAALDMPGLTVGPGRAEPQEDAGYITSSNYGVPWDVTISIRAHVAYIGGVVSQSGLVSLVDSIVLKLRNNHGAISGYTLGSVAVEFDHAFDESETVGAVVFATYKTRDEYTQE